MVLVSSFEGPRLGRFRSLATTLAAGLIVTSIAGSPCSGQTAGLAAAYSFDEGSGGGVTDASGNGNAGTVRGAKWTAGRFGSALEFSGTGALVTVNDSASLDLTTGMTLEAWVYPTSTALAWKDVIYKGVNDIYYLEGSSPQRGAPAMGGTFCAGSLCGTAALPLNTWAHLAATYDGAVMRLYVNGAQVRSRAQARRIQTSTGALTIGGDPRYGQYWAGRIDEVRIYNRALSAREIQSDMNSPVSVVKLVAAYGFEEGSGPTVTDASGNGNAGTVNGATWAAGRFGSALEFNGTGALVTVNDSASLDLRTRMTLEAWVYPTSAALAWKDVIYKGVDDIYYLEGSSPQGGAPAMGGTFSASWLSGTAPLPLNTWAHLAGTYDGAVMRLYVNGAQVSSRAQAGPIQTSTGVLTIGGDSLYGQYWAGRIDEVRIYNGALSASEIQRDMSSPVAKPAEPMPTPDPSPSPVPGTLLRLAWDPVTTDVQGDPRQIAGYRVYAAESGSPYRLLTTTAQASTELRDLLPLTVYVIAVKAFDLQDMEGDFSAPLTVLTP